MFLGREGRLKTKQRENQERDRGEWKRPAAFNWRLGWEASCWAAREEGPLGKDLRNRVNRPMEVWMFPSYLLLKTTACLLQCKQGSRSQEPSIVPGHPQPGKGWNQRWGVQSLSVGQGIDALPAWPDSCWAVLTGRRGHGLGSAGSFLNIIYNSGALFSVVSSGWMSYLLL